MNTKKVSEQIRDSWNNFTTRYDFGALPAFMIFLVVVTLGMLLNYISMRATIGQPAALLVSGLFEFGILGWKWTSGRKRNNDKQIELVNWATWLSVLLAVFMLVINLFRTTIEQSVKAELSPGATFNGWQIAAYITIGLAALVHIVFYLSFDQNDTDKEYARKNKRSENEIRQRSRLADDLIKNTDADLNIIEKITVELEKLRVRYQKLPHAQLEGVLEDARQALLKEYAASPLVVAATAGIPDLDHSGAVGDEPVMIERPAVWISDEEEFQALREKHPEVPGRFILESEDFQDAPPPVRVQGPGPRPEPSGSRRPLYNEPSYHPIDMTPKSDNGKKPKPNEPPFK